MSERLYANITTEDGDTYAILCNDSDESVYIPSVVNGCNVSSVMVSNGIKKIDEGAFLNWRSLTNVTFPDTVTRIEKGAFQGCCNLKELVIPDSVIEIGVEAFSNCSSLMEVTMPNSVTDIGYGMFSGCSGLTRVSLSNHLKEISESMFRGCSRLKEVEIPGGVTSIGNLAFSGCTGLKRVILPDSVREIGVGAFSGCIGLEKINIPTEVIFVGDHAFSGYTVVPRIPEVASAQLTRPNTSIYLYLKAQLEVNGGHLPRGFKIPWLVDHWAPGGADGVSLYHMQPLQEDRIREQTILKALKLISEENNMRFHSTIMSMFEQLNSQTSIVRLSNEINGLIGRYAAQLDMVALAGYADYLITYGTSLLAVKVGLTILAGFNYDFIEEVMLTFGAYDEFTYFAVRTFSQPTWENGNKLIFQLAQNVYGWGRIHAVSYLQPDSQVIKNWLLYEGAKNDILPQYSADDCLQKSGVKERLNSTLSHIEFEAIGVLIGYALEEGPCSGITDADQILPKYLMAAADHPIDRTLIQMILNQNGTLYNAPKAVETAKQLLGNKE